MDLKQYVGKYVRITLHRGLGCSQRVHSHEGKMYLSSSHYVMLVRSGHRYKTDVIYIARPYERNGDTVEIISDKDV